MRAFFALVLIAAANCVPVPQAINWTAVEHRFQLIRDGAFPTGFPKLVAVALEENPEIGAEMAEMVAQAQVEAFAILDQAIGPIAAQNLSQSEASYILYDYDDRVSQLHGELTENVEKLSDLVLGTWANVEYFYNFYDSWTFTQTFYFLLDRPLLDTDWQAAAEYMGYVSGVVGQEVSFIKEVAYSENQEVGDAVTPILDAAFGVTIDRLDTAQSLIRNQTWTLAEAVAFFGDYNIRDYYASKELEPYLFQLSNDALFALLMMSYDTYTSMHSIALTIYDNIGQVDRFGCCSDGIRADKHLDKLKKFKGLHIKKYVK